MSFVSRWFDSVTGRDVRTSLEKPFPIQGEFTVDTTGLALEATLQEVKAAAVATQNAVESTATVAVSQDTSTLKNGATSLTPKFAAITSTGSGDTVALVASKKIRVLSLVIVVAGATTVKFQTGAASDLTGAMSFAANGGVSLPYNPLGWFETTSGAKLNHVLGSSVAISGALTYVEV